MKKTTRRLAVALGLTLLAAGALLSSAPEAPSSEPDAAPVAASGTDGEVSADVAEHVARPASGWVSARAAADAVAAGEAPPAEEGLPTREERLAAREAQDVMAAENRAALFERTLQRLSDSAERAEKMGKPGQAALMRKRAALLAERYDAELDADG